MAKIERVDSNLFPFPQGAFVRNKGYVYVNISNKYIPASEKISKSGRGYTDHDSVCIGVLYDRSHPENKQFYANARYHSQFLKQDLPVPPKFSDSVSAGLYCWIKEAAMDSGLAVDLTRVFGEDSTKIVLDLCAYMLSRESAVMQHVPSWARDHVIFEDDIPSDTYLGKFLKNDLSISKINQFKYLWVLRNIGDGKIYLCYDSTNVNSQAEGVFLVQKGHAKDDPALCQVNTDYVIRQSDGLPLTYMHSPGSVTDIAQAQEMIRFIEKLKKESGIAVELCLICDRGYISGKNLRHMDRAGIGYILMLRTNFALYDQLADACLDEIRSYKNELVCDSGDERYGVTKKCILYEGGPECFAQVIWSADRYRSKRRETASHIEKERLKLEAFIKSASEKCFTSKELKWIAPYFKLKTEPGTSRYIEKRKRGRGTGTVTVEIPTVKVIGYEDDEAAINRLYAKSGIIVMITSGQMTAQETEDAYAKRDSVEKTFQALKSHLGMDKIGVTTEEAMHGKGLVWFTASILHSILFNKTMALRSVNKKHYTVPAIIEELEAIKADRDLSTGKRQRRYKLTSRQLSILNCWNMNEQTIDTAISDLYE